MGLYMDIRPEVEIEVPDGLKNEELVQYLHKTYYGILNGGKACARCGGIERFGGKGLNQEGLCDRCAVENSFQERENRATIKKYKK